MLRPVLALFVILFAAVATADDASNGERIESMGLPPVWKPYAGAMLDLDFRDGTDVGGELLGGVYRDLTNPVIGLGAAGEIYGRVVGGDADGGARLMGVVGPFGLKLGGDVSFTEGDVDFLLSLDVPLRRGGLLGRGGFFRVDYFPGRDHSVNVGLTIPLGQPWMGKTRPSRDNVRLPRAKGPKAPAFQPEPDLIEALDRVRHAAGWIKQFTTPFIDYDAHSDEAAMELFGEKVALFEEHLRSRDALYPGGHNFEAEIRVYHRELERAFALAEGGERGMDAGARLARHAREALLEEVILPYNRLLGQRKTRDSLLAFRAAAAERFAAALDTSGGVPAARRDAVTYVFHRLLGYLEEARKSSKRVWGDSRLVWIPLSYALRSEDHDTQRELDAILERVLEKRFLGGNDLHYVWNEQFQKEAARMVLEAEDYHVLWIHDFRGYNNAGDPDYLGFAHSVDVYLRALRERVRAYDETGKLPAYFIFLDQIFFEVNGGRLWMELLYDPLRHQVELPAGFSDWEERIRAAQEELRAAVAGSSRLQAEAARHGEDWLHNRIRVHVSITNPSDFSFRSGYLISGLPVVPDNMLRDHRKIAFYDLTERDSARGEALFTGMGIGEHYGGPTWDDRALLVRGPAALHAKTAARELLLSQGFAEDEIPPQLRPVHRPPDYAERVAALEEEGWTQLGLQVHNATGYGPKPANLVKAVLYELMPPGSHMYIPDSLWNSPLWGAMLVGSSLRGCKVFVIAPSWENAPSAGIPQMSRANEVLRRLLVLRKRIRGEIEEAGGMLEIGLYDTDVAVNDAVRLNERLVQTAREISWFREIFPFHPDVWAWVEQRRRALEARGFEPRTLVQDVEERRPKLHFKSQFFGSPESIETLIPRPEWLPVIREFSESMLEQAASGDQYVDVKTARAAMEEDLEVLGERWWADLSPRERERVIQYLLTGSQNQDYRGKIMDGEVTFVVSHMGAILGYIDFVSLMGQTTWVETAEEMEPLLPTQSDRWRRIGRFIRNAL